VRVLNRGHFHVGILIDHARLDIVRVKCVGHRPLLAFRYQRISAFGVKIGDRALDQRLDAAAVDVDRLGALIFPFRVQQRRQAVGMVAVRWVMKILPTLRKS
jgi:hypothetical protein